MPAGQQSHGVDQVLMTLDRVQIPDRHEQTIVWPEPELIAQRGAFTRQISHTVGDRRDLRTCYPQIATHLVGKTVRDGDGPAAERDRGAHREPPLQPARVIPAAVHGDDMVDAGKPRGPAAVNGQ